MWERGWVPAYARTREGVDSRFRLCGGGFAEGRGWVPHTRGQRMGMGPRPPPSRGQDLDARTTGAWGRGTGGSRTAPTEGEYCRARGSPPSPVFTRAGSNLPPSRGKGFVGDERAIFTVMTCGGCAALRSGGTAGKASLFGWCNCGIVSRFGRRVCVGGRF